MCVKALGRMCKGPRERGLFIDSKSWPYRVTCLISNQSLPYMVSCLPSNQTHALMGFLLLKQLVNELYH